MIVRFLGGIREIGGNKIVVEEDDTRILFDFGKSFSPEFEKWYAGYLQPRSSAGLRDYFEFGLLPRERGLYAKEILQGSDLAHEPPRFDAVLLSHAHYDHASYLRLVDPAIPVHLGETTKLILDSNEESGALDYGTHPYQTFRTGKRLKIGSLQIDPIHVDHSIPGAYGYVIRGTSASVAYTGDFRRHGTKPQMTEDFLTAIREDPVDALITEGTRVGAGPDVKRQPLGEPDVQKKGSEVVNGSTKGGFVTFYGRDYDRIMSFYNVAKQTDRTLLLSPRVAHYLGRLRTDAGLKAPDPSKDPNLGVYFRPKKSGQYIDKDYLKWERTLLDARVSGDDVKRSPRKYLVNLDFSHLAELNDLKPEPGSLYLHSMSEPFSEEDEEAAVLQNWMGHHQLEYVQLHASGHASATDLQQIFADVLPGSVVPIHTENPDGFASLLPEKTKLVVAKLNEPIEF